MTSIAGDKPNGTSREAILGLIFITSLIVLGSFILIAMDRVVPEAIISIGSAAVGALATMLARKTDPPIIVASESARQVTIDSIPPDPPSQ